MKTKLFFYPFTAFIALFSVLPYCSAATLGYWNFEEGTVGGAATIAGSVLDSSANSNIGNPSGEPTYSADVASNPVPQTGQINSLSMSFDGVDDTVLIPTSSALNSSGAFTVEFWFNSTDTRSGQRLLVDKSHGFGDNTGWAFQTQSGTGIIDFALGTSGGFLAVTTNADLFDGAWYHIAGTYDGNTAELFVDGISQGTTTIGTFISNTRDIRIASARNNGRFYSGEIDEIRISDTVLTTDQFLNVPEPSGVVLFGLCAVLFSFRRRR